MVSVEELILLIENVADSVAVGQCNPDDMALLLSTLRSHGMQLEDYSKFTLDQGKYLVLDPNSPFLPSMNYIILLFSFHKSIRQISQRLPR